MGNLFYDLPCEIIDKIYKINILEDIKDYEVVGHLWDVDDNYNSYNSYNLYENNFTIWNGFDFEWVSDVWEKMDHGDTYGTYDYPIECGNDVYKYWNSITPHYVRVSIGKNCKVYLLVETITSSSCLKQAEPV